MPRSASSPRARASATLSLIRPGTMTPPVLPRPYQHVRSRNAILGALASSPQSCKMAALGRLSPKGGQMFDLIIQGGDVVTPRGVVRGDVAISGETIAAIAAVGALPADSAARVLAANSHLA